MEIQFPASPSVVQAGRGHEKSEPPILSRLRPASSDDGSETGVAGVASARETKTGWRRLEGMLDAVWFRGLTVSGQIQTESARSQRGTG